MNGSYNSNESYKELFLHNNEVLYHQNHLRILTTEVFKSLADITLDFINIFHNKKNTLLLMKWKFLEIP